MTTVPALDAIAAFENLKEAVDDLLSQFGHEESRWHTSVGRRPWHEQFVEIHHNENYGTVNVQFRWWDQTTRDMEWASFTASKDEFEQAYAKAAKDA